MPNLYISNMVRSIFTMTKGEVTPDPIKPAAIFFDYLQAFPIDPEVKRAAFEALLFQDGPLASVLGGASKVGGGGGLLKVLTGFLKSPK
jgi:hypothetical protein